MRIDPRRTAVIMPTIATVASLDAVLAALAVTNKE